MQGRLAMEPQPEALPPGEPGVPLPALFPCLDQRERVGVGFGWAVSASRPAIGHEPPPLSADYQAARCGLCVLSKPSKPREVGLEILLLLVREQGRWVGWEF